MGSGKVADTLLEHYLSLMKQCVRNGDYAIANTVKNRSMLYSFGFTVADQEAILLQLTPNDFVSHEPNRDRPDGQYVWIYRTRYEGHRFYVKYYFLTDENRFVVVMSDHLEDSEMKSTWHK